MTETTVNAKQPQVYRYGGLVVRYHEGRLVPLTREPVAWSRFHPPLPRRLRRAVQKQARELETQSRLARLNVRRREKPHVELPPGVRDDPWTDLTVPTGASA